MFGGATELYKNRFHAELDQLKYDEDDYVYYPDVIRRRWMWHQPVGGNVFSGADFTPGQSGVGGVSQKLQFNIPNNTVTDPTSYRLYFKCYVGDSAGGTWNTGSSASCALANYAHSVFNQLTVRFTGSASTIIEQVPYYNVFSSMIYQFYTTNYVQKFHNSLEGYSPCVRGASASAASSNALRAWNGRSFMLPLNVGFFMNLKKFIPNFCLPYLQLEFLMETNSRALVQQLPYNASGGSTGAVAAASSIYYINSCQLIVSEVEVTSDFINEMREKISAGQTAQAEVRLDFNSWTYMSFQVPAGTTGVTRNLLTGNFVGIRKVMFSQMYNNVIATSAAYNSPFTNAAYLTNGADQINSFVLGGLQSYRLQIGGRWYPDQEIYVNYGSSSSTNSLNCDMAMGQFFNMFAVGCQNNTWSDIIQDWGPSDAWLSGVNTSTDFVMILSTEFDDAGLPILTDYINSGPLALLLNYGTAVQTGGLTVNVFVNVHRAIHIYDGNRATIVEG